MPYKTQSPDTDEKIERMQFDRLRSMGRHQRYQRGLALVDEGLIALKKNLKRSHPTWTPEQLRIEWTRIPMVKSWQEIIQSTWHVGAKPTNLISDEDGCQDT